MSFVIFDLQVTPMLPTKFKSVGLSIQEKKRKIDFEDGRHSDQLGFPIGTILPIFDLQVTPMLSTKFQVSWPSVQEKKRKKKGFSRWLPQRPFRISDRNDFSYF